MRIVLALVLALVLVALAGCAAPQRFDISKAAALVPGVTTMEQAVAALGPVHSRTRFGQGTLLQWARQGNLFGGTTVLGVLFDANGVMVREEHRVGG